MTDILLGHDRQTNQRITIKEEDRLTGMYVIGTNGTGKSTLLANLIVQDIQAGLGLCLLDPHGDLTKDVLMRIPDNRLADVILLDPLDTDFPFGLNVMSCFKPNDPPTLEHAVEQIVQIFTKVFGMSVETPRLNQYIRNIAYTLIGTQYTMVEIPNLLLDSSFRTRVVANVSSPSTRLFWKSFNELRPTDQIDRSESTRDRIDSLVSNSIIRNIVGQSHTTIDFRQIMDSGKILLVQLAAQYESLTSLLGSIIIGQLLTAALSRATSSKRRQFNLYADEYQRFATPDFATLLTEARKFGVATTIAHQVRAQLDEKNAAMALNAGSIVVFHVTPEDADELAPAFDLTPNPADEREKTIPSDVLMHLSDHPNQHVKDFERIVVRKLLQAKALRVQEKDYKTSPEGSGMGIFEVTKTETIYPKFTFDDAPISFNPNDLLKFLEVMETFLFDVMIHKKIDMHMFNYEVMLWWAYCCSDMYIPDPKRHVRKDYSKYFDPDYERRDKLDINERYERFKRDLLRVAAILMYEPVKVFPSTRPNENTAQQTYADKRNQIANELTQMLPYTAHVKLPHGEHIIKTIPPNTSRKERMGYDEKRIQVVEQTRANYCTPRAEIEEQIRHRQDNNNPSPIKRTHTL